MQTKVDPSSFFLVGSATNTRFDRDIFSHWERRSIVQTIVTIGHARLRTAACSCTDLAPLESRRRQPQGGKAHIHTPRPGASFQGRGKGANSCMNCWMPKLAAWPPQNCPGRVGMVGRLVDCGHAVDQHVFNARQLTQNPGKSCARGRRCEYRHCRLPHPLRPPRK